MDRKQFLKACGYGCLAGSSILTLMAGCSSTKILSGEIKGSDLLVSTSDFEVRENGGIGYKKYVIVRNDLLKFPICVYRSAQAEYTALLMECTHQGSELQVFGDRLQCPSHGSEFDDKGAVKSGPAYLDLRSFPTIIENNILKISLRKA